MKKLLSLFIAISIVMGTMCFPTFADSADYLSADFEDGTSPFTINSNANGSAVVVNAADEGIAASGNVLKVSSGTGNNYIVSAPVSITETKPVIMEARFMNGSAKGDGIHRMFTLNIGGTGRSRDYGILTVRHNKNIAENSIGVALQKGDDTNTPIGGDNKFGYLVDAEGKAIEFAVNTWYKIKATYQIKNAVAVTNLEIYDADGNLMVAQENISHNNDIGGYTLQDINTIGIGARSFSGKNQVVYVDDVLVYDYKEPAPLSVSSSFNSTISASNSVTIPFSADIDATTLSGITVSSKTSDVPEIVSKTASGKDITITFAESLANDGIYNINLAGVKSTIGTTLENANVTVRVKPEMADSYLDLTFDNGASPFTISNNATGSAVVVNAADEGIAANGKVLKVSSGAGNNYIVSAPVSITETNPVVMEARFMNGSAKGAGIHRMFTLNIGGTGRSRDYGILTVRHNSNIAENPIGVALQKGDDTNTPIGGENKFGYLVDAEGKAVEFAVNTWYKVKVIYQIKNAVAVTKLEIYDAEDNLMVTQENISHNNDITGYTLQDINTIGFGARGYSGKDQIIYVDDLFVYDYKAPEALAVASSFGGTVEAGNTITIPFNLEVDNTSLSNIAVTSDSYAVPEIVSKTASGKNVTITFAGNLAYDGIYNVNLAGVKSAIGTTLENANVTVRVKPEMTKVYVDETFDDGEAEFTNGKSGSGSAVVVDAKAEGIDATGKVLKVSSSDKSDYITTKVLDTAITGPVVMETRFMTSSIDSVRKIFTLYSSATSRNRPYGMATIRRNNSISTKPVMFVSEENNNITNALSGDAKAGYLVDYNGNPLNIEANKWYKLKLIYSKGQAVTVTKLQIFDDAGNLIKELAESAHTYDSQYPLPDITEIGFGVQSWGNNEITYIDNVYVYDYVAPEALALEASSIANNSELAPTDAKEITLDFNNAISAASLNNLVVTADNEAVNFDATLVGDSTVVKVTVKDALVGGKSYKVDYSKLVDVNGSSVEGAVAFTVKAGQFVNSVTFDKAEVAVGTVSANVSITNSNQTAGVVTLVAALYDIENDLVALENVTLDENVEVKVGDNNLPISITVPAGTDVENAMIQVMVLKSIESLEPLSAAAVLK